MNSSKRVMLLIDADNVSGAVIEQAIHKVKAEHGAIHIRRAYCTAESALTHQKLFKACSIRPIVNLSSGKNANDIALAVDAMDLVVAERPDIAVIVSSDSDFAPLVIRLREKGCRVEGIGQLGKTGEDSKSVYDEFVDLAHQKPGGRASPPARRSRSSSRAAGSTPAPAPLMAAPTPAVIPPSAPVSAPATAPAPAPASRRRRASPKRAAEQGVLPLAPPAAPVSAPVPAPASEPAGDKPASRRRRSRR